MILYFQIHLLEDTSTLKFSLKHQDGTWCENIIVPELRLLANSSADDHLVISFDQSRKSGADLMVYFRFVFYLGIHFFYIQLFVYYLKYILRNVYFSCIPKGKLHLPMSLREMINAVKHSKVKLFNGDDLDIKVIILKKKVSRKKNV